MASTLVTIFGLPLAAARLVAALVQGEEAKDYAAKNGLSYETVRYHLKVAFARTGARSQSRLLQMVTKALSNLQIRR
jgi:DNA-binding CsgD family transcriptional regulator